MLIDENGLNAAIQEGPFLFFVTRQRRVIIQDQNCRLVRSLSQEILYQTIIYGQYVNQTIGGIVGPMVSEIGKIILASEEENDEDAVSAKRERLSLYIISCAVEVYEHLLYIIFMFIAYNVVELFCLIECKY